MLLKEEYQNALSQRQKRSLNYGFQFATGYAGDQRVSQRSARLVGGEYARQRAFALVGAVVDQGKRRRVPVPPAAGEQARAETLAVSDLSGSVRRRRSDSRSPI